MLLRKGLITYRALEESVRALKAGKRQGTILVENGAIRSRDLVEGVTEQVQEIIYSLFGWEEGAYEFEEGDLPSREVIVLRMSTRRPPAGGHPAGASAGAASGPAWARSHQRYALSARRGRRCISAVSLHQDEMSLVATLDGVLHRWRRSAGCSRRRISRSAGRSGGCGRRACSTGCRRTRDAAAPARSRPSRTPSGCAGASVGPRDRPLQPAPPVPVRAGDLRAARAGRPLLRAGLRARERRAPGAVRGRGGGRRGELDPIALRRNIVTARDRPLPARAGPPAGDRGGARPRDAGREEGRRSSRTACWRSSSSSSSGSRRLHASPGSVARSRCAGSTAVCPSGRPSPPWSVALRAKAGFTPPKRARSS